MDFVTLFTVVGALAGVGSLIVAVIALRGLKQQRLPAASRSGEPYYEYDEPYTSSYRQKFSWFERPLWQNGSKLAILLLSVTTILVAFLSLWANDASRSDPTDIVISIVAGLLTVLAFVGYFFVWILGMFTALRHRRWGWFFLVLGLTPFATLAYAFTE